MATQSQIQSFVNTYAPYAQQAAAATGLNAQLILAQWGNETAYGTDFAESNNIGNVGVYSGGPNPSYPTVQAGVQAYINEINSPAMKSVKATAGQSIQAQAEALGKSGYAGSGYNAGSGPGSALLADANVVAGAGFGSQQAAEPAANVDWKGLQQAVAEGGGSYLQAQYQASLQGSANASSIPDAGTANANTQTSDFNIPGYGNVTATGQQASALETLQSTFAAYGFNPTQTQQLTQWAWGEIVNNTDPTQVAIDLQTPGTTGYQVFEQQFPGFVNANQQLASQRLPAVSVAQYAAYQTQAQATAQAAGLPAGFINSQMIGTLVGNNVSASELSSRINNALTLAYNSTPQQQAEFNAYFGGNYTADGFGTPGSVTPGHIAALALDPTVAEPLVQQEIQAAQIGGAGVAAGVGSISQPLATQLAQAGVTNSQALSGFQQIAPLTPLETALPGTAAAQSQGTVTADQLAQQQFLGDASATRALQVAEETRKAPFAGGGGDVSTQKGLVGAGSAQGSGTGS